MLNTPKIITLPAAEKKAPMTIDISEHDIEESCRLVGDLYAHVVSVANECVDKWKQEHPEQNVSIAPGLMMENLARITISAYLLQQISLSANDALLHNGVQMQLAESITGYSVEITIGGKSMEQLEEEGELVDPATQQDALDTMHEEARKEMQIESRGKFFSAKTGNA